MAKRNPVARKVNKEMSEQIAHQPPVTNSPHLVQKSVQDLVDSCKDFSPLTVPLFANHAKFFFDETNLIIDFYALTADPNKQGEINALAVKRIICPIHFSKGLASALANSALAYEDVFNTKLRDGRGLQPGDRIDLWK